MKVWSKKEAWELANRLFPTDYEKDEQSSERAGYPTYRSTAEGHYYDYICDLNDRLELNYSDGRSENIWIEELQVKRFPTAIVGAYQPHNVFGDVTVIQLDEIRIENVEGMIQLQNMTDNHMEYELTVAGGDKRTFRASDVAYIRFEK